MSARPQARWRVWVGGGLFVLGLVLPLCIPFLFMLEIDGWMAATLAALFALGLPELLWLAAILLIGRAGFRRMQRGTTARLRWWWRRARRR